MGELHYPAPGEITRVLVERAHLPNGHPNLGRGQTEVPMVTHGGANEIENVVVLPGILDLKRLKRAIANIVAVWPIISSHRMSRKNGEGREYYYDFSNQTVPLSIQTIVQDLAYPSLEVMQSDMGPFSERLDPNHCLANTRVPQVSFCVTKLLPSNRSVLGVNISHQVLDGYSTHRFLRQFSDFYTADQGGEALANEEWPNFFPYIKLPEEAPEPPAFMKEIPVKPMKEVLAHWDYTASTWTLSNYEISLQEIEALKTEARAWTDVELSKSDVMAGWWLTVQERRDDHAREKIGVIMSSIRTDFVARPEFPMTLRTLAANCLTNAIYDCPPLEEQAPEERMAEIAAGLRKAIIAVRKDPDGAITRAASGAKSSRRLRSTESDMIFIIPPIWTFVNSMVAYDWLFDFGFPKEQVSYHTTHPKEDGSRIYRANCKPGQSLDQRGYELSTYTAKSEEPEILVKQNGIIEADRQRWKRVQEGCNQSGM